VLREQQPLTPHRRLAPHKNVPPGSLLEECSDQVFDALRGSLERPSDDDSITHDAKVKHIYSTANVVHLLAFLHTLLIWATEMWANHHHHGDDGVEADATTEKEEEEEEEETGAKRSRLHDSAPRGGGTTGDAAATAPMDHGTVPPATNQHAAAHPYNTLTSATIVLRELRSQLSECKDGVGARKLLTPDHIRPFVQQADATIVSLLKDIGFSVPETSIPPAVVLDALGLSSDLCRLANIRLLYHTPGVHPEQILPNGLDIRYSKIGSYGRGAYFTDNPAKARAYFRAEWNVSPDVYHPDCLYMVASLVALGRTKVFEDKQNEQSLYREPDGFDSIAGKPRDRLEFAVYNSSRILLTHIVYYTGTAQQGPPVTSAPPAVMIPAALRSFFTQLIQRADKAQQGTPIRHLIRELLKSTTPPRTFVDEISRILQAPAPPTLADNLEKQIALVRSSMPPSAAGTPSAPATVPLPDSAGQPVASSVAVSTTRAPLPRSQDASLGLAEGIANLSAHTDGPTPMSTSTSALTSTPAITSTPASVARPFGIPASQLNHPPPSTTDSSILPFSHALGPAATGVANALVPQPAAPLIGNAVSPASAVFHSGAGAGAGSSSHSAFVSAPPRLGRKSLSQFRPSADIPRFGQVAGPPSLPATSAAAAVAAPLMPPPISAATAPLRTVGAVPAGLPSAAAVPPQTRKTTVVLPRTLKAFFEDIKQRVKPQDHAMLDRSIFDVVSGTTTAQAFLAIAGRLMNAQPPPELATRLEQQLAQAKFRCDTHKSMAMDDASAAPDAMNAS
jgi:hypothetical protein